MSLDTQVIVALATFGAIILLIAFDWLDMTVAAMFGVVVFTVTGILTESVVATAIEMSSGTLALLFGGMVVARVLIPTGIFDIVGAHFLQLTAGSGKRLLLGLIVLVAPLCAFLPNATIVLLLAPVVIRVAVTLKIDFVPLLVLTAIVSNAAGLLTLVGDPATFIVGSAIRLSFVDYLLRVSAGGLLSIIVIIPLLPLLFRGIWHAQVPLPRELPKATLARPAFAVAALATLIVMIALFVLGEDVVPLGPPAVAILGATLALLAIHGWKVEPVARVFSDIDWRTLIFILCMFLMVQGLAGTGILLDITRALATFAGSNLVLAAVVLLIGVGAASSVLANIPVVVAMVLLVKGYLVLIEHVPEEALGQTYLQTWPDSVLPVFVAMMFGGTLGGNATLIGASANVVAAGIAVKNGGNLTFGRFARYGVPITLAQLVIGGIYMLALFQFLS